MLLLLFVVRILGFGHCAIGIVWVWWIGCVYKCFLMFFFFSRNGLLAIHSVQIEWHSDFSYSIHGLCSSLFRPKESIIIFFRRLFSLTTQQVHLIVCTVCIFTENDKIISMWICYWNSVQTHKWKLNTIHMKLCFGSILTTTTISIETRDRCMYLLGSFL